MKDRKKLDDLFKELSFEYRAKMPKRIQDLKIALSQEDFPTLESLFHKYKGTGKTHGFADVSDICALAESIFIQKSPLWKEASQIAINLMEKRFITDNGPISAHNKSEGLQQNPDYQRLLALARN
jgi:HPt (histidine-containing phosphotransfer) domain-containing protein